MKKEAPTEPLADVNRGSSSQGNEHLAREDGIATGTTATAAVTPAEGSMTTASVALAKVPLVQTTHASVTPSMAIPVPCFLAAATAMAFPPRIVVPGAIPASVIPRLAAPRFIVSGCLIKLNFDAASYLPGIAFVLPTLECHLQP